MELFNKIKSLINKLFKEKSLDSSPIAKSVKYKKNPFDSKLVKMKMEDFSFTEIILSKIAQNETTQKFSIFDFIELFNKELPNYFDTEFVSVLLLTPYGEETTYKGFVYLKNKNIVPICFSNENNIAQWNSIFLERYSDKKSIPIMHKVLFDNSIRGWFEYKTPKNIGQYIFKYAPREFKISNEDIAFEKQKYLQKYINIQGAVINLEILKTQFLEYLNKNNVTDLEVKNNELLYQEFEELANFTVPAELQALFEIHNGVKDTGFLSVEKMLQEWKGWNQIYNSVDWTLEYLTGHNYSDNNKTLGIYTNPYWVPFYSTEGGAFYAIDYAPNKKGTSGQIISFGRDTDTVQWIATDLLDFMRKVLSGELAI
jgi:cell wall assembly regulator SMI1